jgi:predicted dehydrogenase
VKTSKIGISRRDLIRATTILPAAAIRGSAANSAPTVGLIGAGGRGTTDARLLTEHTAARITAISDLYEVKIDAARQRIPAPGAKAYKDYHELLASDVDAVIIATPVFLHPEHFEAAVKAGKHIYIEKPAAPDVAGCKRIMRAADSADRKLNITFGFQGRYGQVYQKAKAALDTGAIGKLRMVHLRRVR